MEWQDFVIGVVSTLFAYALFTHDREEDEIEIDSEPNETENVLVNDFSQRGTRHTLYCERCRKKKRHKEINTRVFECMSCHRTTDLRIPS